MKTKPEIIKAIKKHVKSDIAYIKEVVDDHLERKSTKKEFLTILKAII